MTVPHGGVLIGRDEELDRLGRLVRGVVDGFGRSVWIDGEPGIGKSALVESALSEARRLGCQVLSATADEFGRRFPLHVMMESLGVGTASPDPARREIAELLSHGGFAGGAALPDPVAAATERLIALVEGLVAQGPLVLAVDDLQWADEVSVPVLLRLGRLARRAPLLLVAARRTVPRRADLEVLKRGLIASGAETIVLEPLSDGAVTHLLTELAGGTPGPGLLRTAGYAGGSPLYLREIVDALAAEGTLHREGGVVESDGTVPRSLTATITDRLAFLSAETAETLRAAALLGTAFSVTDLGAVIGRSALELTAALDEATAAGLLVESEVRFAFRQPLIRHALYERMPAALRLALHRQAARALADAGLSAERVAEQLLAAPRRPDAVPAVDGWAVDWLLDAGHTLVSRAPEAAAALLELAVDHLPADDARRESLEGVLAPALVLLGRRDEAVRLAEKVIETTRDPVRSAKMSWILGRAMTDAHRHRTAQTVLGLALRTPGLDETWTARLRVTLARAAVVGGDLDRADTEARRALGEAERSGDRGAVVAALNVLGTVLAHRDDPAGAAARFERGLALVSLSDGPEAQDLRLALRQNHAHVLMTQDRHADAEIEARELLADAERTAAPPRLAGVRLLAAEVHYRAGRWDDALAQLDAATAAHDVLPVRELRRLHGLAALVAVHRDDQASAEAHLAAAPAVEDGHATFHGAEYLPLAAGLLAERRGRPDEALTVLTALLDRTDLGPAHRRHAWLPTLLRVALAVGDTATAERAAQAASTGSRRGAAPGVAGRAIGSAANTLRIARTVRTEATVAAAFAAGGRTYVLGTADARAGRSSPALRCRGLLDADEVMLTAAVDACRTGRQPLRLAQTLEDAAVVLAKRGDLRAARAAHAEASDLYIGLGATWDLLRADTRLRGHGVSTRRGQRRRAATGWDALTPAELTIARLVAEGRANPDIAASLFVSRRTVEVHVSHILAKLGVRSRVEIAREAARRLPATQDAPPSRGAPSSREAAPRPCPAL